MILIFLALLLLPVDDKCRLRGDGNLDGELTVDDVIQLVEAVEHAPTIIGPCFDYVDANGDGELTMADPFYLLAYLFQGGPPPPAPVDVCCEK